MVHFLNLPPEIINFILYDLSPPDLYALQLSSKYLDTTIRESVVLQHNLALTRASAEDCPSSNLLTAEKLEALRKIEDAWISMKPDFVRAVPVPLRQSGVYDLTGGVYLLSNADRTGLGLLRLPVKEDDKPEWTMYTVGKMFIDVGLCVHEHDLMAIVTSTLRVAPAGSPNSFTIEIELVELSSRKPHPLAQKNPIFVMHSAWEKPSVGIEIVGKHLVLILSFNARGHPQDRVFIYEWQTGVTVASFEARSHTYAGLIFLDEEHILLPNTRSNALDIFRIPPAPTLEPLRPILVLSLPQLSEGRILGFATCRAEPNPIGKDSYATMRARQHSKSEEGRLDLEPHRGFLLKSSTALCMIELRVHIMEFTIVPGGGLQMNFPFRFSFTFVAPRQAFLDLISKHGCEEGITGSNNTSRDDLNTAPPPPAPSGNALETNAVNVLFNLQPGPPPHQPSPPTLRYEEWGPECTAWFGGNEHDVSTRWITTSVGRRCVRMPTAESAQGGRFFICEFGGPIKVRRSVPGSGNDERPDIDKGKARDQADGDMSTDAKDIEGEETAEERQADHELDAAVRASRMLNVSDGVEGAGPSSAGAASSGDGGEAEAESASSDADGSVENGLTSIAGVYASWLHHQPHGEAGEDDEMDDGEFVEEEDAHTLGSVHDLLLAEDLDGEDDQHDLDAFPIHHGEFNDADIHEDEPAGEEAPQDDSDEESWPWETDPAPALGEPFALVDNERVLDCPQVFRQPIQHNLPYIVRSSRDNYQWEGVLLDEERVIGIKADDVGHVEGIEVLHFG